MIVVFDTNILVSALLWRGTPFRCLMAVQAGLAELVLAPPIVDELRHVPTTKFALAKEEVEDSVAFVHTSARLVQIPGTLHAVPDDPDDDKFIETSQVAGAQYLVSGDKHLLRLGAFGPIKIVSARAFLDVLRTSRSAGTCRRTAPTRRFPGITSVRQTVSTKGRSLPSARSGGHPRAVLGAARGRMRTSDANRCSPAVTTV